MTPAGPPDPGAGPPEAPAPGATPKQPPGTPDPARLVRAGLVFYGVMAVLAVLWRMGLYGEEITRPRAAAADPGLAAAVLAGVAVGLATVGLSYVATEATGWGERLARSLAAQLGPLGIPDALLLACASGFAEELFFRGALQPRVGLVVASLAFGLVHFVPRRELLPWTGFAVVMGFVFGWLFEWSGHIAAPVAAHTVVNAVNLPLLVRRYGPREDPG